MSKYEKSFYVPMDDLVRLYDHADLGETKQISAICYPHKEYQLKKLKCKKFIMIDEAKKREKELEKVATDWMNMYYELKNKYEPEIIVTNRINSTVK